MREILKGERCHVSILCVMRKIRVYLSGNNKNGVIGFKSVKLNPDRKLYMLPGDHLNLIHDHSPFSVCLYRLPPAGGILPPLFLLCPLKTLNHVFVLFLSNFTQFTNSG